jgi:hypothetical protein
MLRVSAPLQQNTCSEFLWIPKRKENAPDFDLGLGFRVYIFTEVFLCGPFSLPPGQPII